MEVTKTSRQTFKMTLTKFESEKVQKMADRSRTSPEKLLEHIADSGLFHAYQAFESFVSDSQNHLTDEDGNSLDP